MKAPRISANQLARYLTTDDAAKRRAIFENQNKPKPDKFPLYYPPAEKHITDAITGGLVGFDKLLKNADEIRKLPSPSDWYQRRNRSCAEAIEAFVEMNRELNIHGCELFEGDKTWAPKLEVGGVDVSVRPEILLTHKDRKGKLTEGAIKLYINKNEPLINEAGNYAATLLRKHVEEFPRFGYECNRSYCYVVDVFAGRVFKAPHANKRRWRSIEAACEEIRNRWHRLSA